MEIPDQQSGKKLSREQLLDVHKELLSSIRYASFIQQAVLPEKGHLDKLLNEYFILFLPRDIVSGDFYYCSRKDRKILFAVGDCTGHGVPGALMSIMGISFLNDILSGKGPWKPGRILNLLRERVMKAMRQTGSDDENKDAMDMALLVFNEDTGVLEFSGANNPLYHLRNGILTEYKGDKMPVGINAIAEESFSNTSVQLISDDIVYLFSDGFADQFGGPGNRKYKYGPFKKLLTEISGMDMEKQKEKMNDAFKNWKGDREQVDDILVAGIKLI